MSYDIEDLLDDVIAEVKENLPAKLIAIETEKQGKGKGVPGGLAPIPDGAYYLQAWDNAILNHKVAIYYGLENVTTTSAHSGAVAQNLTIFLEVVLTDLNNDGAAHKRIHRYSRALRELMEDYCSKNSYISRTKIEQVRPISFRLELDTSDETHVGGVSISTSII